MPCRCKFLAKLIFERRIAVAKLRPLRSPFTAAASAADVDDDDDDDDDDGRHCVRVLMSLVSLLILRG